MFSILSLRVIKFKFCTMWLKVSLGQNFKFLGNENSDTVDNVAIASTG